MYVMSLLKCDQYLCASLIRSCSELSYVCMYITNFQREIFKINRMLTFSFICLSGVYWIEITRGLHLERERERSQLSGLFVKRMNSLFDNSNSELAKHIRLVLSESSVRMLSSLSKGLIKLGSLLPSDAS